MSKKLTAKQLIKMRREMGMSQAVLAIKIGRSTRYLTSREIEEKPISDELSLAVSKLHEEFKQKEK